MAKIKFSIITLFPEAIQPYLDSSMLYKAQKRGIIEVEYVNLRDFGLGPHKSVDDTPYGGGDGMLLRCEPVFAAVESLKKTSQDAEVIIPTPVGKTWNQQLVREFANINHAKTTSESSLKPGVMTSEHNIDCMKNASESNAEAPQALPKSLAQSDQGSTLLASGAKLGSLGSIIAQKTSLARAKNTQTSSSVPEGSTSFADTELRTENLARKGSIEAPCNTGLQKPELPGRHYIIICPHYEGYDERILSIVDHQISLGNYVLTGGELPALIIIDSVTRLLPGVLGGATSAEIESFSDGDNLEYPQYTKPADFRGMKVPEVLLSGHHGKVAEWRQAHSGRKEA